MKNSKGVIPLLFVLLVILPQVIPACQSHGKLIKTSDIAVNACNHDSGGTYLVQAGVEVINSTQEIQMYFFNINFVVNGQVVATGSGDASDIIPGQHIEESATSSNPVNGQVQCVLSYATRQPSQTYFNGIEHDVTP